MVSDVGDLIDGPSEGGLIRSGAQIVLNPTSGSGEQDRDVATGDEPK